MRSKPFIVHVSGQEGITVPDLMGKASPTQLLGTPLEQLAELAGRVCYDSLGNGRGSAAWHAHVKEVGHLSVYEHCAFTVEFKTWRPEYLYSLVNRPSIYVDLKRKRVTLNLRHALEMKERDSVTRSIRQCAFWLAPNVMTDEGLLEKDCICSVVKPESTNEVWVSMFLHGSRAFTHELVRHGDWTAISQRSTRYVDESESEVFKHPLMRDFMSAVDPLWNQAVDSAKAAYAHINETLYKTLIAQGEPIDYARKQSRGAARMILPNGLETQLIFSASLSQWLHINAMRNNRFADGEIAEIARELKEVLFAQ